MSNGQISIQLNLTVSDLAELVKNLALSGLNLNLQVQVQNGETDFSEDDEWNDEWDEDNEWDEEYEGRKNVKFSSEEEAKRATIKTLEQLNEDLDAMAAAREKKLASIDRELCYDCNFMQTKSPTFTDEEE